jgi:hypothetical protein
MLGDVPERLALPNLTPPDRVRGSLIRIVAVARNDDATDLTVRQP